MKKSEKIHLIIVIIGLPLFIYLFFFSRNQNKLHSELEENGVVDTALIERKFIGAKRKLYYKYIFHVNKKLYDGFLQYSTSFGSITVGDSCLVKYLPKKPDEINVLIKSKDNQLIIIK